ncbi:MAG: hypothetical protein C5B55_13265 [Blastocatellia bacterium]|nr:MAG: hypothetical protein C5B55_13265 [Blastocatellia bacterium]
MSQNPEPHAPPMNSKPNVTTCSNCHSPMPAELRFCRNCGFRLGEGLAEYNETVRFGGNVPAAYARSVPVPKKPRRMSGMTWIFVGLLVFFVCAAAFTAVITPLRHVAPVEFRAPVARSWVGTEDFDTTDGGVTFEAINIPDGPADKAGLVGGDIITTFDGQTVTEDDQMMDLLKNTPVGKTVDVVYIRDGETKTTKLTTISEDESKRLQRAFDKRPEGKGQFGYEDGDSERVQIPNSKLYGVKLNSILNSRPADLAGVKEGDVVIEFGGVPIRTRQEFLMRVRRALPYSTMKLVVMRGDQKLEIPVKMGKA